MAETEPGDGTITRCYSVRFERRSKHSAARLWRAITDPAEIAKWTGYPARVDLRPGGEWQLDFGPTGGGELDGIIFRVEPERVLAYVVGWSRPEAAYLNSVIEWQLRDEADGGCAYDFVQSGLLDRGEGEEAISAGWHEFFEHLDAHLDGSHSTYEARHARWEALNPRYRDQLERLGRG